MLQLYSDIRIGGRPKFILAHEPPTIMVIPDEIRKCVAYVGLNLPNGEVKIGGTAFVVRRNVTGTEVSFYYIITAAHSIKSIKNFKQFDGKVVLRVNTNDGESRDIETSVKDWYFHTNDDGVDVALLHQDSSFIKGLDVIAIPDTMFFNEDIRTQNDVGIGDEVFLTGLFLNHKGRTRNIPIVRMGNIVAMREEKVKTQLGFIDAYLVESRSVGGLSGSPVFVRFNKDRKYAETSIVISGNSKQSSEYYFLGLMHGHFDLKPPTTVEDSVFASAFEKERINMGIAIVVPCEKILEVMDQTSIKDIESQIEKDATEDLLPTMDFFNDDSFDFEDALRMASRKVSPPVEEKKETSE
jgi:hypothetical protein